MKFQKMELISAGTDFDVIRYLVSRFDGFSKYSSLATGKPLLLVTSTKLRESRGSESL